MVIMEEVGVGEMLGDPGFAGFFDRIKDIGKDVLKAGVRATADNISGKQESPDFPQQQQPVIIQQGGGISKNALLLAGGGVVAAVGLFLILRK